MADERTGRCTGSTARRRPTRSSARSTSSARWSGAIREDRLAHAFLFCGPRGTGKTSTARILAKMVNCEHGPDAPSRAASATSASRIREGTHLDVVEIDAASHGGVDDARELRERAPTAPAMGREKVYILDEAQRLSREAFDALLKLFEEPPPGVRFVLATTEPHKMPATIVGRCQRFDFRRIGDRRAGRAARAGRGERGRARSRATAAEALARQAEGSARDARIAAGPERACSAAAVIDETVAMLVGAAAGRRASSSWPTRSPSATRGGVRGRRTAWSRRARTSAT